MALLSLVCNALGLLLQIQGKPSQNDDLHEVQVRIVDSFGNVIPDAKLQVSLTAQGIEVVSQRMIKGGEILRLKAGPYRVDADSPGFFSTSRRLLLRAPREIWVICLEEAPSLISIANRSLTVQRPKSDPTRVDEARLRSLYLGWEQVVPFDENGVTSFRGMPNGRYELILQNLGYEISRSVIDVKFAVPQQLTWDMNEPGSPAGLSIIRD